MLKKNMVMRLSKKTAMHTQQLLEQASNHAENLAKALSDSEEDFLKRLQKE